MLTQVLGNLHFYNSRKDTTQMFESLPLSIGFMLSQALENVHLYDLRVLQTLRL